MGVSSDLPVTVGAASSRMASIASSETVGTPRDTPASTEQPLEAHSPAGASNVRGAYPLLLVGAAVLAYGVLVSVQTPGATVGRFEVWPLLVVIGATVVGAGVFSLYFAIEEPVPGSTSREVEELKRSTPANPPASAAKATKAATPGSTTPPWWEGLPEPRRESKAPVRTAVPTTTKPTAASMEPHVPATSPTVPPRASSATIPPITAETDLRDEVASTLKELEAISREISSSAPSPPPRSPVSKPPAARCSDCGRPVVRDVTLICEECGNLLCANCARDTALSTGVITCRSCRDRTERTEPSPSPGLRGGPRAAGASGVRSNNR